MTEAVKLLKPNEAADLLSIGERTLWRLTTGGEIVCIRIGRAVRYDPADLAAYVERQKTYAKAVC